MASHAIGSVSDHRERQWPGGVRLGRTRAMPCGAWPSRTGAGGLLDKVNL